jgi:hypothetical protein
VRGSDLAKFQDSYTTIMRVSTAIWGVCMCGCRLICVAVAPPGPTVDGSEAVAAFLRRQLAAGHGAIVCAMQHQLCPCSRP